MFKPSKRFGMMMLLALCFAAAGADYVWKAFDNFHEVLPGMLYRSGQLSGDHFKAHGKLQGIRTVINLRGANPKEDWYREEVAAARVAGVKHIDLPIDSLFPTKDELAQLANTLESCPKPVLIHCQSGIDRTGIAAALACLLLDDSSSTEAALDQLTWRYGCLPWRKSREDKRDFLLAYESWLGARGVKHSCQRFRDWLREVVQISDLDARPCPRPSSLQSR